MQDPVLVLGATGKLGGEVVRQLQAAGYTTHCATRNPDRGGCGEGPSVCFDWKDPATYRPALDEIRQVFLTARPLDIIAAAALPDFLDDCREAGVEHVVFSSALGTDEQQAGPLGLVESHLQHCGLNWTILRPNFFMQNFSHGWLLPEIQSSGGITLAAGSGRTSFVSTTDIAAVAVKVFTEPTLQQRAYELTGDDPMSHTAVAAAITRASGRPVNYHAIDEDEMRAAGRRAGFSPGRLEYLLVLYGLVRDGSAARVTSTVKDLLGRDPVSFNEFAAEHAHIWKVAAGNASS